MENPHCSFSQGSQHPFFPLFSKTLFGGFESNEEDNFDENRNSYYPQANFLSGTKTEIDRTKHPQFEWADTYDEISTKSQKTNLTNQSTPFAENPLSTSHPAHYPQPPPTEPPAAQPKGTQKNALFEQREEHPRIRFRTNNSSSDGFAHGVLLAVLPNMHSEIGIGYIAEGQPKICISQFADSRTFSLLKTHLEILRPCEIVFPITLLDSPVYEVIRNYSHSHPSECRLLSAPRRCFNETRGFESIKRLIVSETVVEKYSQKYLAMSCVDALLHYISESKNLSFIEHTMQLEYLCLDNVVAMDYDTIKNLEVVTNFRTGSTKETLFSTINYTKTTSGARFLKTALLFPACDAETLNGRLDSVEDLLNDENLFFTVQKALEGFADIGKIILDSKLVHFPTKKTRIQLGMSLVKNIRDLHASLKISKSLGSKLCQTSNSLFIVAAKNLENRQLDELISIISQVLEDQPPQTGKKASHFPSKLHLGFALKSGIDSQLDIARQTMNENMEDLFVLVSDYKSRFHIHSLKLNYSAKSGHYLSTEKKHAANVKGNKEFSSFRESAKTVCFSSDQLERINQRNKDSWDEVMLTSENILQGLLSSIRQYLGAIYSLIDSIAWIDMIGAFASYVTLSGTCCRPQFATDENAALVLKQARHPILAAISTNSVIANDVYCGQANFQIITGPNMSGKSTYIRQVALLHIMAHVGCYVPAAFASFRITERIFSRIGTFDQINANASTFSKEMSEIAFILQNVGKRDLVIIDELGRGTNGSDALPLCWSICEHLAITQAFTFFVTHIEQLTNLEQIYPKNIKNYHLRVDVASSAGPHSLFQRLFQIGEGPTQVSAYGILTAEKANIPLQVIKKAREFKQLLNIQRAESNLDFRTSAQHVRASHELVEKLLALRFSSLTSGQDLQNYLTNLKNQYLLAAKNQDF